jgi:hypothetical protein
MPPQSEQIENTNPFSTSASAAYAPPMPQSSYQQDSDVTTFGVNKGMRSEHNLGGDGSERSSVKVHHPPGGGGSLNIFGGSSGEPNYAPQQYDAPSSYNAPSSYESGPAGVYTGAISNIQAPQDYNQQYSEEQKQTSYQPPAAYYHNAQSYEPAAYEPQEPSGPSGFTQSTSYVSITYGLLLMYIELIHSRRTLQPRCLI